MTPEANLGKESQIQRAADPKRPDQLRPVNRTGSDSAVPFPGEPTPFPAEKDKKARKAGGAGKPPMSLKKKITLGVAAGFLAIAGGVGAAAAFKMRSTLDEGANNNPSKTRPDSGEISVKPFDPNLIEQVVRGGPTGNAKAATEKQIHDFLSQPLPIFKEPEIGGNAPEIKMLLPVNLTDGSSVKIVKQERKASKYLDGAYHDWYDYSYYHFFTKGSDSFALPVIEGATKVEAKVAASQYGNPTIELIYTDGNGQITKGEIDFWDKNFVPTDVFNDLPTYDPNKVTNLSERNAIRGREFDLTNNPNIPLFSGQTHVTIGFGNGQFILSPSLLREGNGKPLYIPTSSEAS